MQQTPDNLILAETREKSSMSLDDCSVASGGVSNKASTLVNGDKELGGSSGATIARALTGARGSSGSTGAAPSMFPAGYLDKVAKRCEEVEEYDFLINRECPGYWLLGFTEAGERFAKELYCGREWCPTCGSEWSDSHQRRYARWLPKAQQMKAMGYFVFTLPPEKRQDFRKKKQLSWLSHAIQELLKRYGFERGLRRWHWFGEHSKKFHPHLNVIVDGNFIPEARLESIKKAYAKLLGVKMADVHYHYRQSPGEKVHTLKYVTRATFKDAKWDVRMALELRGFRNQCWWGSGKWNGEAVWQHEDLNGELPLKAVEVANLEEGKSPYTGLPITWSKPAPIASLRELLHKKPLGAGYWVLTAVPPPKGHVDFKHLKHLDHLLAVRKVEMEVKREQWLDQYRRDLLASLDEQYAFWQGVDNEYN